MKDEDEIEKYAVSLFSDLASYGYSKAIIDKKKWWNTKIRWLREEVGLEMILDVREKAVDLFFVKLENGKLPDGYLMSHGKPCRYYLGEIVKQKPFIFGDSEIEKIKHTRNKIINSDSFQEKIEGYHEIIINNIAYIIEHENRIFADEPTRKVKRWLP